MSVYQNDYQRGYEQGYNDAKADVHFNSKAKELVPSHNNAMVPCCGYCDGNACLVNTTMICKDKPCLISAQHQ